MMGERRESGARREQIAEAALAIVVEKGVGGMTAKNVARLVGLTPPALYRHYKSKADILSTIIDYIDEAHALNMRKAKSESSSPLAFLRSLFFRSVMFIQRHKGLPSLFLSDLLWLEEPRLAERLRANLRKYGQEVAEAIRQGQAAGQIRPEVSPDEAYIVFFSLHAMLGILISRQIHDIDLMKQAETNWTIFEKSVGK